jgi:hypothetical protein
MRIGRRSAIVLALAAVGALGSVGIATAITNNKSTVDSKFSPSKAPKRTYKPGSLFVHTHTDYAHPGVKAQGGFPKTVTLLFDDDGKINPKGIPTCAGNFSSSTTLSGAMASCKRAKLGSGRASTAPAANLPGCVLAFNGKKQGGDPTIVLFTRVFPTSPANCSSPSSNSGGFTSVTISGKITKANVHDFGNKLTVSHLDQLALSLDDFKTTVKRGKYVSIRCHDKNKTWNTKATFTYSGSGQSADTVSSTQTCRVQHKHKRGHRH